jgi:tyrosyl-tRNA synthetase
MAESVPNLRSEFLRTIVDRGYLHQATDLTGLDDLAANGPVTAYVGYDATGDSLHVGNLISIMLLRILQRTGHKPIVLMGGGTTKVGDPSGKDSSRQLLTNDQIQANIESIKSVFSNYLTFGDGPTDAIMVNNDDWLSGLHYISFLRDYGRHFSVNRMLGFDSVKLRLEREQPLSFLEFNYMILQAYDFVELYKRHGCVLQMGGSDQWGNIVNGVELGRRLAAADRDTDKADETGPLHGLTSPLITTASGAKMGKTAEGAVWLKSERLSAFDYWQFWRNTADADVGRFLALFTELPMDEIQRLSSLEGAEINEAKKILATEATALCHGSENAIAAAETAQATFEDGKADQRLPTIDVPRDKLINGLGALEAFVTAGLADSNGDARRLIKGGGARVNDEPLQDEKSTLNEANVDADGVIKLSAGKKRHALIRPVQ